jgi:hypothetical protein
MAPGVRGLPRRVALRPIGLGNVHLRVHLRVMTEDASIRTVLAEPTPISERTQEHPYDPHRRG